VRTDDHNNPTAMTTDIAKQGGLVENVEYIVGAPFPDNPRMFTAKLLLNPIELTIRVIDNVGFYTKSGAQRWTYIGVPKFLWDGSDRATKVRVIGFMYGREGGTAMRNLFPTA
jgi:hypothetical protein